MRARKRSPCRSITFSMRRMSVMSEPMPRIMEVGLGQRRPARNAAIHRGAHRRDGSRKAGRDCIANQEVTDVELGDLRKRRDRLGGGEVEPVPGMHLEAELAGERRA